MADSFQDFTGPDEVPVSAGAMLFNRSGQLLILRPTYKSGWTIPGGAMAADGESPWDACRREVQEETGLVVITGRLAAVDTRPGSAGRKLGLRFLFDCGELDAADIATIRLQHSEIAAYDFVTHDDAMRLLRKPIRRRVRRAWGANGTVYLENGRPVLGVQ